MLEASADPHESTRGAAKDFEGGRGALLNSAAKQMNSIPSAAP